MKTPLKTKIAAISLFTLTAAVLVYYPTLNVFSAPAPEPIPVEPSPKPSLIAQHPIVEAVFVLDTTGSMGGLIQAAKDKIWSIASTLAAAEPAPQIRIGLVAYRDRGDEYVTRVVDLTPDLDGLHAELMQLQAQGGGDGPESVNQALHEALHRISWGQDQNAYRVIFLVGDAPPHMDYQNDVPYPRTLNLARQRGIRVNAIQCGELRETATIWREIAQLGDGSWLQVEQDGGAVAIATPYDEHLAELSTKLDETRIYYGDADERSAKEAHWAESRASVAEAAPAVKARRAGFLASPSAEVGLMGENELITEVQNGRLDVADLPAAQLPEPLAKLAPEARQSAIEETATRRDALKAEIQEISARRAEYLRERIEAEGGAEDSLDDGIYRAVREQALKSGLHYEAEAPAY